MIFHEIRLVADDSHEISHLIFSKIRKDVVIGTLRVKISTRKSITCLKRSALMFYTDLGRVVKCVNLP